MFTKKRKIILAKKRNIFLINLLRKAEKENDANTALRLRFKKMRKLFFASYSFKHGKSGKRNYILSKKKHENSSKFALVVAVCIAETPKYI